MKKTWLLYFVVALSTLLACGLVSAVGTYPPVDSSMVLYYHFNNNASAGENQTKVYDFSGRQNNGTISIATYDSQGGVLKDGTISFNGVSGNVSAGNPSSLNFNSKDFTVSLWIKAASTASGKKILNKRNSNLGFLLQTGYAGGIYYSASVGNGTALATLNSRNVSQYQWSMITFTYSNNNTFSLYLNGVFEGNTTLKGYSTSAQPLLVGTDTFSFFNGSVDDLIIYNRSLSSSEISSIYDNYSNSLNYNSSDTLTSASSGGLSFSYDSNSIKWSNSPSVSFNGINSILQNDFKINNAQGFTVIFDISMNNNSNGVKIVSARNGNTGFVIQTKQKPTYQQIDSCVGNGELFNCQDSTPIYDDSWHEVLLSFDGSYLYGFLDRISDTYSSAPSSFINAKFADFTIGSDKVTFFNGSIRNFKFINRSYTPTELTKFYTDRIYHEDVQLIPVLMYHRIDEIGEVDPAMFVNVGNFTAQMSALSNLGYTTITDKEYYNWTQNGGFVMPEKAIMLTFDDGWNDNLYNAAPIMASYGFRGNIMVATSNVPIGPSTNASNWSDLNTLVYTYNWSLMSHGLTHCNMVNQCNTSAQFDSIFPDSKTAIIANTNYTPVTFVYPYNYWSPESNNYCRLSYSMCFGYNYQVGNPRFITKHSNLTNGELVRIAIKNATTIDQFITLLNYTNYQGLEKPILNLNMNEGAGALVNDASGYSNDAALTSATWNSIYDDYLFFESFDNESSSIDIDNLSKALIVNDTGICQGSSSNLNENSGDLEIALADSGECYVLNDFKLEENAPRNHTPLWFSQSTNHSIHIASNISETLSNVTVSFTVPSCALSYVDYHSDTGTYNKTYSSSEFNCSNNTLSLIVDGIEKSSSSNVLEYGCVESWSCSAWVDSITGLEACSSKTLVRTCTDTNLCGTLLSKPAESQECFETAYKEEANSIISFAAVVLVLMAVAAIMIVLIKGPDPVAIVVALVAIIILVIGLFIALRFEVSAFV